MKENGTTKDKPIYVVIGTRAQLIKMAPIMVEMDRLAVPYTYIYTGQHRETIEDLHQSFSLRRPDIDLGGGETSTFFRFVVWWIRLIFILFFPSRILRHGRGIVLTHGDTTTCVWAAVLGKLSGSRVAHIESGLTSGKIFSPFPEEINRRITFLLTDYYFCPNEWAINNLKKYRGKKINTYGNTLADAIYLALQKGSNTPNPAKPYFVFSMHRFENIFKNSKLEQNVRFVEEMSKKMTCVFVLHPITRDRLKSANLFDRLEQNVNIILTKRRDFISFISLIKDSEFVVTDGGSNQEECSYLGHPCLLLRNTTERIEGIGQNVVLSGYDKAVFSDFVANYENYRTKPLVHSSGPSQIIIENLLFLATK